MPTEVVQATEEHARFLATRLRQADLAELEACGRAPLETLLESVSGSTYARAQIYDGEPGAIWGCAPTGAPGCGSVWMLGSDAIRLNRRAFLAICLPEVDRMLARFPVLSNLVDARNTISLRWLERLGAAFGPPVPRGPAGLPFIPFVLAR